MRAAPRTWVATPTGWSEQERSAPAGFPTRIVWADPGGARWEWTSRRHRKGLGLRALDPGARARSEATAGQARARALNLWIGLLFMVGSACFAFGTMPGSTQWLDPRVAGTILFIGSIFFTSAAALQHAQTVMADRAVAGADARRRSVASLMAEPGRIDWWATGIQLIGTLFFNVTTFAALNDALDIPQQITRVWAPDAIGSIAFLVASWLALVESAHGRWRPFWNERGWRISALNMLGSIFFGISAIGGFIVPSTGEVISAEIDNFFTFLGAVCFLWGAALLVPEAREDAPAQTA